MPSVFPPPLNNGMFFCISLCVCECLFLRGLYLINKQKTKTVCLVVYMCIIFNSVFTLHGCMGLFICMDSVCVYVHLVWHARPQPLITAIMRSWV